MLGCSRYWITEVKVGGCGQPEAMNYNCVARSKCHIGRTLVAAKTILDAQHVCAAMQQCGASFRFRQALCQLGGGGGGAWQWCQVYMFLSLHKVSELARLSSVSRYKAIAVVHTAAALTVGHQHYPGGLSRQKSSEDEGERNPL
jgi:hypothetical protein